jgi:antitoxin component of RelBE/YafQ-DinJ toxin-antitoxin module
MPQITARLSPDIRDRFARYAAEVGLDASELARLLIVREMLVQRLPRPVKSQANIAGRAAKRYGERKLTAHFHLSKKVSEFDRYARAQSLSRAAAARRIVERELHEEWLAKAFAWTPRKGTHRRNNGS